MRCRYNIPNIFAVSFFGKEQQKGIFNMSKMKKDKRELLAFTQLSVLLAIEIIVCFTPLGTLPAIGPLSATLSHIPVIITAVILGEKAGAFMGFAFGMCSFIYWSFVAPGLFSFIYTPFYSLGEFRGDFFSLLICFVPRILIGIVTALICKLLQKTRLNETVTLLLAGAAGSLTNTLLVLSGIYVFFGEQYLAALGETKALVYILFITVLTNGLPEALIGALSAAFIAAPVKRAVAKIK